MAKELAVGNLEQMDEETKAEAQQELAHQWSRLSLS